LKNYIVTLLVIASFAFGQFSPGPLSKYHAELEGTSNCIECHELGKKEISNGCIECHTPLKLQIDKNKGYHIGERKKDCGMCHSDHNGEAFELVFWPKDMKKFDHKEAGYRLEGKHKDLKCGKCHTRENIVWEPIITWAKKNTQFPVLDRTFMGLSPSCQTCHTDVHKGEVGNDCASCHSTKSWIDAELTFNHDKAKYLLKGAHQKVDCEKCHKKHSAWDPPVRQLTGLDYASCASCHNDFHKGSYGNKCESCHNTQNWKETTDFDHSKTKYPLEGKHSNVKCMDCHNQSLAGALPLYLSCQACHSDYHEGQFSQRKDGGDCEACHTVNGFKPTTFSFPMHLITRFVLDGGHMAVPCNQCHKPYQSKSGKTQIQFTWKNPECKICHDDEHRNQFAFHYENKCESCHISSSFKSLIFEHDKTEFPLDRKHINVPCKDCHNKERDTNGVYTRYRPVPNRCVDCHKLTGDIR
jgi:hypothetical protein